MNQEKMDELKGLSRNLDSAAFRVEQINKNIQKALEGKPLGPRDDNEVGNLSGQDLLDALTEANKNGHWKGWTFSELNRGGSVLPGTVYDDKTDDIIKHTAVATYGNNNGEISAITLMVTDKNGSRFVDFVPRV